MASSPTTPLIHVLLDRSGSMSPRRDAALETVNGYLHQAKSDAALAGGRFSLTLFDADGDRRVALDHVRDDVPVADCPAITPDEYVPRGATPLLDAVGYAVARLDAAGQPTDPRILVILTDGYENASREHSQASIADLLKQRQADGWLVLFLGAGIDAWGEAQAIGIQASGVADVDLSASVEIACALHGASQRHVSGGLRGLSDSERTAVRGLSRRKA